MSLWASPLRSSRLLSETLRSLCADAALFNHASAIDEGQGLTELPTAIADHGLKSVLRLYPTVPQPIDKPFP